MSIKGGKRNTGTSNVQNFNFFLNFLVALHNIIYIFEFIYNDKIRTDMSFKYRIILFALAGIFGINS